MYGVYLHAPTTTPSSPTHPHSGTGDDANASANMGHRGELEDYDGDEMPVSGVMTNTVYSLLTIRSHVNLLDVLPTHSLTHTSSHSLLHTIITAFLCVCTHQ